MMNLNPFTGASRMSSIKNIGSQESGVRSQNGRAVSLQQPAYLFELRHRLMTVAVLEVIGQNQVVPTFFQRPLRDIHEARLINFTLFLEPFSNVGGNRER